MDLEALQQKVDRLAGGRSAGIRLPRSEDPRVHRAFRMIALLLAVCFLLGVATVIVGVVLTVSGQEVTVAVWIRCLVVFGITVTLFYFLWRAWLGWYWAFRRLQLFSRIFPIVALVLAAIPGLYPIWVISEQILFAIVLIGVSDYLHADYMRDAFPKQTRQKPQSS